MRRSTGCARSNVNSVFDVFNEDYAADLLRDGNILYTKENRNIQELLSNEREVPEAKQSDVSNNSIRNDSEIIKMSDEKIFPLFWRNEFFPKSAEREWHSYGNVLWERDQPAGIWDQQYSEHGRSFVPCRKGFCKNTRCDRIPNNHFKRTIWKQTCYHFWKKYSNERWVVFAVDSGKGRLDVYFNIGRGKYDGKFHFYDLTNKIRDTARRINGVERPRGFLSENGISDISIFKKNEIVNTSSEKSSS